MVTVANIEPLVTPLLPLRRVRAEVVIWLPARICACRW